MEQIRAKGQSGLAYRAAPHHSHHRWGGGGGVRRQIQETERRSCAAAGAERCGSVSCAARAGRRSRRW